MGALLEGSLTIRTSVSDDLLNAKTDVARHYKESSENDGENDGSSVVPSTPTHASNSRVATTTPKISILFNQSGDIKVGYFGKFELLESQRDHHETVGDDPILCPDKPTNQNKTMVEK